jgi:para-nitrobenzyl esterase
MRYALLLLALLTFVARADEPVAQTKLGALRGAQLDDPRVLVFKGVHYGQSTAGAARFKPPRPVAKWQGVADATRFGATCPQGAMSAVARRSKAKSCR